MSARGIDSYNHAKLYTLKTVNHVQHLVLHRQYGKVAIDEGRLNVVQLLTEGLLSNFHVCCSPQLESYRLNIKIYIG